MNSQLSTTDSSIFGFGDPQVEIYDNFHFSKHPNPDSDTFDFSFIQRLLLATTYSFLSISNGSSILFNSDIFNGSTVVREFDSPKLMNGHHTVFHKLPYFSANPALKTQYISKKWCQSAVLFKLGFRISQNFVETGLPYQIECSTCHPTIIGLPTFFYNYPERDFAEEFGTLRLSSRRMSTELNYCEKELNCEQNRRVAPVLDLFLQSEKTLRDQNLTGFSQYLSRWSGEQSTSEENRVLQGIPDGELYITVPWHRVNKNTTSNSDSWKLFGMSGLTTTCGMELDGEILGSNIFTNTDSIGRQSKGKDQRIMETFTYDDYEGLDLKVDRFKNEKLNLEVIVSWLDWSCCTACCCTSSICGYELQTAGSCETLSSSRSRKGFLSMRKIDASLPIRTKQYTGELEKILSIPPYISDGIPLFSTLLQAKKFDDLLEEIETALVSPFLEQNGNSNYTLKSGVFIQSETCQSNPQRLDCNIWAKCHGIEMGDIYNNFDTDESDSCQLIQFVDVLVEKKALKIKTHLNENLRIRMDPVIHDMNSTNAQWRINMRKPKKYDKTKHCSIQGVILKNNEILVIGLKGFDLKIDLLLDNKQKIRIGFVDENKKRNTQEVYWSVLYWLLAIIVFFTFLIYFVIFMHREKTKRIEKLLKNRKNERK